MKNLKFNKWYPIEEYYKNIDNLDWVLVQFKERYTDEFSPKPIVAKFNEKDRIWVSETNKDRYICEMLKPIAFLIWKPYDGVK